MAIGAAPDHVTVTVAVQVGMRECESVDDQLRASVVDLIGRLNALADPQPEPQRHEDPARLLAAKARDDPFAHVTVRASLLLREEGIESTRGAIPNHRLGRRRTRGIPAELFDPQSISTVRADDTFRRTYDQTLKLGRTRDVGSLETLHQGQVSRFTGAEALGGWTRGISRHDRFRPWPTRRQRDDHDGQ